MSQQQPKTKAPFKAITPEHLIVSTIVTTLIAAGDAGLQYVQSNGATFSVVQLAGAILVALFATLGTGVISLEKNPTVQQTIDGALLPHLQTLSQLTYQHLDVLNELGKAVNYLTTFVNQQQSQKPPAAVVQPANVNAVTMGSGVSGVPQVSFPPAQPLQGVQVAPLNRHFDSQVMPTPPVQH